MTLLLSPLIQYLFTSLLPSEAGRVPQTARLPSFHHEITAHTASLHAKHLKHAVTSGIDYPVLHMHSMFDRSSSASVHADARWRSRSFMQAQSLRCQRSESRGRIRTYLPLRRWKLPFASCVIEKLKKNIFIRHVGRMSCRQ